MTDRADVFANSRVLVTGAAGFIGGHLCRRLSAIGARVHAVSRRAASRILAGTQTHVLDLADAANVERIVREVEPRYVFHLASHVNGSRELAEVGPTFDSNLASTVHLLRAITDTDCRRIVLAGSLEEPDTIGAAESQTPSSPYAASKAAASMYARMFHRLYGTPVTIARIFMVYGPGQHDTRKLVPYVATSLLAGRAPRLSSGERPVDWVYVDDVVDALMACATMPDLEGETLDIGTGQMSSIRRVAEQIAGIVGKGQPIFGAIADRAMEQVRAANGEQTARLLGRPLTTLERGLRQTVDWYREHVADADEPAEADA